MELTATQTFPDVRGNLTPEYKEILTNDALLFVSKLHRKFESKRNELLKNRKNQQAAIDAGYMPGFLEETKHIRESEWNVSPIPHDLKDRRVEITGPVERKMIINALNSGAKVFMADFEDSNTPTWSNSIEGQINLRDAVNKTITFYNKAKNKTYQLNEETATLIVRPRGWHLNEKHILVDNKEISASLFDFGLYFYHNAANLLTNGSGPYFYLPKMESHLEARLWNDVFVFAQNELGIPQGSIKATVLIETILAAFEMDEILYELKDHSAGLNCGRWDYIFSYIKKFRNYPEFLVPDRTQVGMTTHFMRSYSLLAIKTCHKRKVHAIGGMAAQIPIKDNPQENEIALSKVFNDKKREATDGHDGTWVAHPGLVPVAMKVFNQFMPNANQIEKLLDVEITSEDLLKVPEGTITLEGIKLNIDVVIQYIESWLRGVGCVPIYNLMEDAATAEISRTQLWQWIHHQDARISETNEPITASLYKSLLPEILEKIKQLVGAEKFNQGKYLEASELVSQLVLNENFEEFLTLGAYKRID